MIQFDHISLYYTNAEQVLCPVGDGIAAAAVSLDETPDGVTFCRVSGEKQDGFDPDLALVLRVAYEGNPLEYMASEAHSRFWCRPAFGNVLSNVPAKSQLLLIRQGEDYTGILPLCDSIFKTLIRGCEEGIEFCMYTNCRGTVCIDNQLAFISASDRDPYVLLRRLYESAAVLLDNGLRMREERVFPELFEYIGWCSWDAFPAVAVDHAGLVAKAREFAEKQVPIHYAIIDDMWADCPHLNTIRTAEPGHKFEIMHQSKMRSFEGAPDRFPGGMKAAIADMKEAGIPHIGVWFPTTGYWQGADPEGEFYREQKENLTDTESGRLMVKPADREAYSFFSSICARIRSWGADMVKIDNQGCHHLYHNVGEIGRTGRTMQNAIDAVTASTFNGALINCMGMPSECMFNRRSSAVCRCSDDFQPENRSWFAKHILQCAYNGLGQGQYYVNDWDMWWTDDEQAIKNSVCRAVSGGPIYVSDKVGRTRREVLMPLIFEDGRILRCDNSAAPTMDCLTVNPTISGRALKIRNTAGEAGIVAAFNIDCENRTVFSSVSPADAGLPVGKYAWYEYFTGECGVLSPDETIPLTLAHNDEFRLYTFLPYRSDAPMFFGRLDKMIGIKAMTDRIGNAYRVYEGGTIGFMSEEDVEVLCDGMSLPLSQRGRMKTFDLPRHVKTFTVQTLTNN